ncbi:MAG TPA: hypothetical protein VFX17_03565 [Patescibacteria group bacterium]|nr:hypothetical protein [Patescibacteria group bacterium]
MKRPLWVYIIGVIIALIIVNYISYLIGGTDRLRMVMDVSIGFLLGMLAMYIAVHLYTWK